MATAEASVLVPKRSPVRSKTAPPACDFHKWPSRPKLAIPLARIQPVCVIPNTACLLRKITCINAGGCKSYNKGCRMTPSEKICTIPSDCLIDSDTGNDGARHHHQGDLPPLITVQPTISCFFVVKGWDQGSTPGHGKHFAILCFLSLALTYHLSVCMYEKITAAVGTRGKVPRWSFWGSNTIYRPVCKPSSRTVNRMAITVYNI